MIDLWLFEEILMQQYYYLVGGLPLVLRAQPEDDVPKDVFAVGIDQLYFVPLPHMPALHAPIYAHLRKPVKHYFQILLTYFRDCAK
jgi:hypothetical protein